MALVLSWFRLDVRRRWRSLLVLALLIALAAGTVMTAVSGARRGASAMDRLQDQTLSATVLVAPVTPGFDWTPVRALPEVEALAEVVFSPYEVDGQPAPSSMMFPPADAEAMSNIERPVVLDGRLPDPTRADEVVITPAFAAHSGKGVGDTVNLRLFTPEQVDTGQIPVEVPTTLTNPVWILTAEQMDAALARGAEIEQAYRAAGPAVEATIVGVIRSPWFSDMLDADGFVVPSAGLFADHAPHLLGAKGLASINALVRLGGGEADIAGFQARLAEITGRSDIDVWNLAGAAERTREVARFEATSLGVFAVVAGLAATLLIGLAMARYAASTVTDLQVLRTVGMTPRQSRRAALLGPMLAAVVGTVVGAGAAVVASQRFPIGSASVVEPGPGLDLDPVVLIVGMLGVPLLIAVTAAAAAGLALRTTGLMGSARPSTIASAAARAGAPVPAVLGARFALEPGRERRAVPVRTVLIGAVAGVAGVVAALTFSSAVSDATTNPARLGVLYHFEAWAGFDNFEFWPADRGFAAVADVPGVAGVNDTRAQVAEANGEQITVFSLDWFGTPPGYVVTEGRLPVGPTEVLLGQRSARSLGAELGDTVALAGTSGEADLVVVGIGFVDFIATLLGDNDPAGAAVTREGYGTLFADDFMFRYGQVQFEPGADIAMGLPRLYEAAGAVAGGTFSPEWIVRTEAREPAELRSVRTLPMVMAAFLAVLALGAVGYALRTAVRRRRYDIAVLQALGMTRGQSRITVATHATVVSVVGLAIGAPLGVALGRTVWRYVADIASVHYVPPVIWPALLTTVVVTLVAATVLAAWLGRRAATIGLASVLRAE